MDLAFIRKIAGLVESSTSSDHVADETQMFSDACTALNKIREMCEQRIAAKDVTAEHKTEYTELLKDVERVCAVMQKHLKSYE